MTDYKQLVKDLKKFLRSEYKVCKKCEIKAGKDYIEAFKMNNDAFYANLILENIECYEENGRFM